MLCWDGSSRTDAEGIGHRPGPSTALLSQSRSGTPQNQARGKLSAVPRIARDAGSGIALAITYEAR